MKFQTLTSTFVLSLLLAGPEAVAMDLDKLETDETRTPVLQKKLDQTEGEKSEGVTPHPSLVGDVEEPITVEDLTRSVMDLDLFKVLVAANQPGATLDQQSAGERAAFQALNKAAQKKQEEKEGKSVGLTSTVSTDPILLNPEEEKVVFSLWNFIFGKDVTTEEINPTPIVISTPIEKITEEVHTQTLTCPVETPITVEETPTSWLANLNPLNLIPLNWWGTTNSVKTPTEDEVIKSFVNLEIKQEPSPSQTNNLTTEDKRDGE